MLVTTVTAKRQPFFSNPAHAREAVEQLYRVQQSIPFFLYGFVIMPDQCHVLLCVRAPGKISDVMRLFKMGLSFQTGISPLWQKRFHIRIPDHAGKALHYIHRNSVSKKIVETAEDYPWSSASGRWDVTPLDWIDNE